MFVCSSFNIKKLFVAEAVHAHCTHSIHTKNVTVVGCITVRRLS